jgi:hypothetical protein
LRLRGNIDGLLPVSVAESDEGVESPPMLVFKDVRQVLKIVDGFVAYGAKRPIFCFGMFMASLLTFLRGTKGKKKGKNYRRDLGIQGRHIASTLQTY